MKQQTMRIGFQLAALCLLAAPAIAQSLDSKYQQQVDRQEARLLACKAVWDKAQYEVRGINDGVDGRTLLWRDPDAALFPNSYGRDSRFYVDEDHKIWRVDYSLPLIPGTDANCSKDFFARLDEEVELRRNGQLHNVLARIEKGSLVVYKQKVWRYGGNTGWPVKKEVIFIRPR